MIPPSSWRNLPGDAPQASRSWRALTAADLARGGDHPEVGFLTVNDLLHEWIHHDANHLRQMLANVQAYTWPRWAMPSASAHRTRVPTGQNDRERTCVQRVQPRSDPFPSLETVTMDPVIDVRWKLE